MLVAMLALVANIAFADTVVTFTAGTDNGQFDAVDVKQGGTGTGADQITKSGVTIATSTGAFAAINGSTNAAEYRIYKNATFTASVTKGTIKQIVFTCTANGTTKQGPGCFTGEGYTFEENGKLGTWTGNSSSVALTASSNQVRATKIEVTIDEDGNSGENPDTPEPPATPTAENIAAFKALASGTTAVLTLKDAVVLYKNEYTTKAGATNTEYYVRDASGAIQFYNTGLELAEGKILNGTVEGKYSPYNEMPELAKSDNTSLDNITVTEGTVTPTTVTVADLTTAKYLCDLVTVKGTFSTETEGEYTNTYIVNGENKVMVYDKFKTGVTVPSDDKEYEVKGILVSAKLSGNIVYEFAPLSINNSENPDTPEPPATPTAENIAAFKALASGTTAVLTLKDAVVLYKNEYTTKAGATNTEYYVRDASGAIQFFNTDLALTVGQILNGTVEGKYSPYNEMPELTKSDNTSLDNITVTEGKATPTAVTVADLTTANYLCDLVTVKGIFSTETEGEFTNSYIVNGENKVMVYDKFKTGVTIPSDESEYEVKGILVTAKLSGNIVYELAPLSINVSTGINDIKGEAKTLQNGATYNIAGQRVSDSYKGIVIVNGKKMLKK